MISVGYQMPSLYLMTRLQSVEGNRLQVLTLSPFYSLMSSFEQSKAFLAQGGSLALTRQQILCIQHMEMGSQRLSLFGVFLQTCGDRERQHSELVPL